MKIILNGDYGGFNFAEGLPWGPSDCTNPDAIAYIEKYGTEKASAPHSHLYVVTLPEDVTDYIITEYDGVETIYYIQDGKIHEA